MNNGKLLLIGLGPGSLEHLTPRAQQAIAASEAVVGYRTYLDLIHSLLDGKQVVSAGMQEEVDRARRAVELALEGRVVAVVSSGDAGIYGMAGLVYELLRERGWPDRLDLEVEVVPGISALNAAASLLGAPLSHDFAAISLSDLLTPWETIARRLELAAAADFVLVLYNPASGRRREPLEKARQILLAQRAPSTPVGVVTSAYRDGQKVQVTDLEHLLEAEVGMLTTLVVGNSHTFSFAGHLVTPRGYSGKYALSSQS